MGEFLTDQQFDRATGALRGKKGKSGNKVIHFGTEGGSATVSFVRNQDDASAVDAFYHYVRGEIFLREHLVGATEIRANRKQGTVVMANATEEMVLGRNGIGVKNQR